MLPATLRRVRPFLLVAAATLAIVDLAAIILLVSGAQRMVWVGFRVIRPRDVVGAAQVATGLCGIVMVLGWDRRAIRYAALVTLAGVGLLAMANAAASSRRAFPIGDFALIESYTLLATQRKLVVGPYSRYGWHHPGPLYFWLAAPFYALAKFKTSGIHIAVQCINASSLLVAAWIAARFASPALIAAVFVAIVGYLWRAWHIFVSMWNPHVPVLPTIALTFVCAAIACGEVALIPLAAFLASFVAQTSIGLLPCAAGLCVIALLSAAAKSHLAGGVWIDAPHQEGRQSDHLVKGRRFDAAFAGVVLAALTIAFWSVTRVEGLIPAYGIVWITAVGLLATATLCVACIRLFTWRLAWCRRPTWATTVICSIFLVAYGTIIWQIPAGPPERLTRQERQVSALFDNLREYCERSGIHRPLLRVGQDMWAIAAGLGLQLQLANRDFAVSGPRCSCSRMPSRQTALRMP